eukprot:2496575-Prymnesium_polylepis.1
MGGAHAGVRSDCACRWTLAECLPSDLCAGGAPVVCVCIELACALAHSAAQGGIPRHGFARRSGWRRKVVGAHRTGDGEKS